MLRIDELEANLRTYLGIPSIVGMVEKKGIGEKLGLSFELDNYDKIDIFVTSGKISHIDFVGYFNEDSKDPDDFEIQTVSLSEEEARELFSNMKDKIPYFRTRAQEAVNSSPPWKL